MTQASPATKKKTATKKIARAVVKPAALVELFVYGITLGSNHRRPVLILKDKAGQLTLPVWLNPVDASYALNDIAHQAYAAQTVTLKLMQRFHLRLDRCVLGELKGHHQFVRLEFSGNSALKHLELRADEAMSLCLATGARFFTTRDFVMRCRDVDAEIASLEAGLNLKPEIGSKNHRYVM